MARGFNNGAAWPLCVPGFHGFGLPEWCLLRQSSDRGGYAEFAVRSAVGTPCGVSDSAVVSALLYGPEFTPGVGIGDADVHADFLSRK